MINIGKHKYMTLMSLTLCILLTACAPSKQSQEQKNAGIAQSGQEQTEQAQQGNAAAGQEQEAVQNWMNPGLFSWSVDVVEPEAAKELFEIMQEQELTDLYQYFKSDLSEEEIGVFLKLAEEHGIDVYYLTGEPEWALEPEGETMQNEVERVKKLNENMRGKHGFAGILMDTEPYLLGEWKDEPESVMEDYVQAMVVAYEKAKEAELPFIACIPFYYDSGGHEEELMQLIDEGCDGIAIMNYSKNDAAGHIATELLMAKKAEKPVTVIYELQEPGEYGLTDNNTYYKEGMDGVRKNVEDLRLVFGEHAFQYALHEYKALREVEGYE